ncbi:hypothetical protein FE257_009096 [Aspergillus nanangensis]|uniref:Kelch repeat protein n=1 Tax=Aspergillus nanangensis TaxID=2582783 RepID=A0AAD4CYH2_ASPNN|nr:hypothetical protein FE257_009096 [Aspergillus nanangensis]
MPLDTSFVVVALWVSLTGLSWAEGYGICNWDRMRVNTIRDKVYIDGGVLWQNVPLPTGGDTQTRDVDAAANLYYLNFSSTFDTTKTNLTALFGTISKTGGAAGNRAPEYHDGAMFANEGELILYGGALDETDSSSEPHDDETMRYERYQYGPQRDSWSPAVYDGELDNDVTRYITSGAGVSAPSENLGFYFSGLHAENWGPVYDGFVNETSDRLITVDMSSMGDGTWSNRTLPGEIQNRINAEAVWIPVSTSGALVIIGGVTDLATAGDRLNDDQKKRSSATSPSFMQTVPVYDIAADKWYLQNTTGETPPMLTQFCSVYASAKDQSSHNIYIYGGFDGLDASNARTDDVYVLSLPSFTWVKLLSGDAAHARSTHRCVKAYPDQMWVVGGVKIAPTDCLDDIISVFNLNTGKFQNTYDPTKYSEYKVPDMVTAQIGGDSSGGATKTAPKSWTNASLADVFSSKYTKTIPTSWPYQPADTNAPVISEVPNKGSSGFPSWAGGIIGAVLGVALLAGAFVFWCLRQRRKNRQAPPPAKSVISDRRSRIMGWVVGVPKSGDTTMDDRTVFDGDVDESKIDPSDATTGASPEAMSEPVHEMPDRSTVLPVELPTTYNNNPLPVPNPPGSPALSSTAGSQTGYVSPMCPATPEPVESEFAGRPAHHRHYSSFSSSDAFPIADVLHGENTERNPHRQTGVSDISEMSVSSEGTRVNHTSETTEETRS